MNGRARWTVLFSTEGDATRVTFRVGRAHGPNALITAILRGVTRFQKKKVRADFVTQLELLEAFLADELMKHGSAQKGAVSPSQSEISKTVRDLVTGAPRTDAACGPLGN